MPEPKPDDLPPKHHPEPTPPHLLKILLDLTEKVGKLEGKMELLLEGKKV